LPPRGEHPPALIAPFLVPEEPEPVELALPATVDAVHLIKLAADGSDRLRQDNGKITVGRPRGRPIVGAPVNDLLGLAICEGLEDALAVHEATGLGAWASASAVFMPALAAAVPSYVTAITIFAHADTAGQDGARALVAALRCRDLEIRTEGLVP
jgi:putative DNA primase/helicase